jgi:hypothetical protein
MTNIHVNDAQAGIIRTALAEYAKSIREQARGYRGGYSTQAIELNVLRLNVEAVIETVERASSEPLVLPIESGSELRQ